MADVFSLAVNLLGLSAEVTDYVAVLQNYRSEYKKARFSSVYTRWLYRDNSSLQTLHWDINCWKDDEVKAWKENCISGYGAVAVAVRHSTPLGTCLTFPRPRFLRQWDFLAFNCQKWPKHIGQQVH